MGKWGGVQKEVYLLRSSDDIPERWTGVGGFRSPTLELGEQTAPRSSDKAKEWFNEKESTYSMCVKCFSIHAQLSMCCLCDFNHFQKLVTFLVQFLVIFNVSRFEASKFDFVDPLYFSLQPGTQQFATMIAL
jgi:hypothetical protein